MSVSEFSQLAIPHTGSERSEEVSPLDEPDGPPAIRKPRTAVKKWSNAWHSSDAEVFKKSIEIERRSMWFNLRGGPPRSDG